AFPPRAKPRRPSLILPKGKRRETPIVSPPRSLTYLSFRGAPRREPGFKYLSFRIRFSGEESAFCRGCPILSRFLRKGGDFFRAAEQNLPSHTCHSEERRDESLLSNTCHSESALAVRNLLLRKPPGVPQGLAAFARPGMSKLSLASHQPKLAIGFSGVDNFHAPALLRSRAKGRASPPRRVTYWRSLPSR